MLSNLIAEMARIGINRSDLAKATGLSYGTILKKVNGEYEFDMSEAKKIKQKFFPDLSLEYLFEKEDKNK